MNTLAWWRLAFVLLALPASASMVRGQTFDKPTLEKIREYGAVYIGYREDLVPFSYVVADEVVGYSMDLCARIVDAIKSRLGDPALNVVRVPVTSISRLLMLRTGVIDLECGSTTNTKIRQQTVDFGVTTFVSGVRAVVRNGGGIERVANLNGKAVVTTAGTTTERVVKRVLAAHNVAARAKSARTHAESLAMVVSGQADAFVLDDVQLSGLLANSPDTKKLTLLEENFGLEPHGIVLRKDDPEFKKLVDAELTGMMKTGEMEKLYAKWFMSPIPPKNINLNIPMSDLLLELFRNPSDTGI